MLERDRMAILRALDFEIILRLTRGLTAVSYMGLLLDDNMHK